MKMIVVRLKGQPEQYFAGSFGEEKNNELILSDEYGHTTGRFPSDEIEQWGIIVSKAVGD